MAHLKHQNVIKVCLINLCISVLKVFSQQKSSQGLDTRCFLRGGGSTLSFFVKESLPIKSVVGRLDIQGDITKDIELILGLLFT